MKLIINLKYNELEAFIKTLPTIFEQQGEVVQDARNLIKKIKVQGYNLNIKRYRIPIFINRIVYSNFRPTKASRAYNNALEVLKRGFETPAPIAYIEEKKAGLLAYSYFVSLQFEDLTEVRKYKFLKLAGNEEFLSAFAQYSAQLHEKEILHKDYSPGNILYFIDESGYHFSIVDINRMEFCPININLGCKCFNRLFIEDEVMEYLGVEYARARGFDEEECKKLMVAEKDNFLAQQEKKSKLKKFFKKKK